jgi:hypothetical protein
MPRSQRNRSASFAFWQGCIASSSLLISLASLMASAEEPEGQNFFRDKIEPVLKAECYGCHSEQAKKIQGGLRLDSQAALRDGGESGAAIVPGNSGESLLIQALRHEGGLAMPPKKARLADATIADFAKWIDLGAPDPRADNAADSEAARMKSAREHWPFLPVQSPAPPAAQNESWVQSPVDAFILAKLELRHWQPAPPASRADLLRRVTFDLIGLPPTPAELTDFLDDKSPDAYERVVDRLLASPQYAERWAQHWLDVVRFAETEGYEYDRHVPGAWRFRDYVIDSFNVDKPFDRFLVEQIAGDEIEPDHPECLAASIFHRLGPVRRNAGNPEIALSRNEVLTERTDIIGTAFLGLTVGCARCHNHKLEPISQKDYYRLQAYLAATQEHNIVLASQAEQTDWAAKSSRIKDQIDALKKELKQATGAARDRLTRQIEELDDQLPAPLPAIPGTRNDYDQQTPIHVLRRGVWESKGERVGPRPLSILIPEDTPELSAGETSPRSHLAHWLASPQNPLTARVFVNRLWQHHFETGLVKTSNDFGLHGDRPSHPELLDWLAARFVEGGWRAKPLHRLIVLSNTYRQSSRSPHAAEMTQHDPENRLLWHFPRRRLSAEEIRDAMLAVSGRLNFHGRGPSVIVPVDRQLVDLLYKPAQWTVSPDAAEHDRRSIYLIAKRNLRLPFLENLDAPALQSSCARRESSTHAPQALELLNGPLSNALAASFAARLIAEARGDAGRIVDRAFVLALGRPPTPDERRAALDFIRDQPVSEFALALFNLNGFLYVL